jgi:hypothetical protein
MGRVKLPLFFYVIIIVFQNFRAERHATEPLHRGVGGFFIFINGTGVAKCGRNVAEEMKMWQNVTEIVH